VNRKHPATAVRRAELADLEAMSEIWWQLLAEHEHRDGDYWGTIVEAEARASFVKSRAQWLSDGKHVMLVAVAGGRVMGFIHGLAKERHAIYRLRVVGYVNDVVVHRDFRGRGVGRTLLAALTAEFKKAGLTHAELMVDELNAGARGLYNSDGFQPRQLHLIKKL